MSVTKELWLCTRQYPSGRGEAFLQHALPIWSKQFSRVVVIPMFEGEGQFPIQKNIEVKYLWKTTPYNALSFTDSLFSIARICRTYKRHGPKDGRSTRFILSHSRQLLYKAEVFRQDMLKDYDPKRVAILSAWMEDWLSVLGSVKDIVPELEFSSLAHGWDLYEHRRVSANIPYRKFQMQSVNKVFVSSARGNEHLRTTFPEHSAKVFLHHLGSPDNGIALWEPSKTLRIVSCSYLRYPKRIDLIALALSEYNGPVQWTHFGDGPLREVLEMEIAGLPSHISVVLRGNTSNEEVLTHYKQNPVDLFMHISESEGLPFAIQEALSFGIPVISNDVGGIHELVNDRTGMLLVQAPTAHQIAEALQSNRTSKMLNEEFRKNVRAFWKENFNADTNYRLLGEQI